MNWRGSVVLGIAAEMVSPVVIARLRPERLDFSLKVIHGERAEADETVREVV